MKSLARFYYKRYGNLMELWVKSWINENVGIKYNSETQRKGIKTHSSKCVTMLWEARCQIY
jgi:hypothetical protein